MTQDAYEATLADLRRRLAEAEAQRDENNRQVARLQAAIANLEVVLDHEPFEGLADAIRTVLKRQPGKPFPPTEVRDGLIAIGYNITAHANQMASVHSVLKRLSEGPDVEKLPSTVSGGFLYRWKVGQTPVTPWSGSGTSVAERYAAIMSATSDTPLALREDAKKRSAQIPVAPKKEKP